MPEQGRSVNEIRKAIYYERGEATEPVVLPTFKLIRANASRIGSRDFILSDIAIAAGT